MKELFSSFRDSIRRLEEVLRDEKTIKTRDSAIKRFEFTAELSWKCCQKFLRDQEIVCRSPKECLKEAFKFGLLEDDAQWIAVFEDRNLTAHTYYEEAANEVYRRLPGYLEIFKKLETSLAEKNS